MAVFGVLAAVLGAVGLLSPTAQLSLLGLAVPGERGSGDHTGAFVTASSMAALNMGVYYVLAALADWRAFYLWTVPFRLLTCVVFTAAVAGGRAPQAFLGIAAWEGLGALATGAALLHERRTGRHVTGRAPATATPGTSAPATAAPGQEPR
ncbi:hypothetical protein [Streptomyces sp. enrichment culture]|uniref:hypothetical protein n=1 Tax=Streptomyces sp. enrichment culture TaxID=1795815 RepID=UPI003F55BD28